MCYLSLPVYTDIKNSIHLLLKLTFSWNWPVKTKAIHSRVQRPPVTRLSHNVERWSASHMGFLNMVWRSGAISCVLSFFFCGVVHATRLPRDVWTSEALMNDAAWSRRSIPTKQNDALDKIGVLPRAVPKRSLSSSFEERLMMTHSHTVDGSEILHQLRLGSVYPIIYRGFGIHPNGALADLTSASTDLGGDGVIVMIAMPWWPQDTVGPKTFAFQMPKAASILATPADEIFLGQMTVTSCGWVPQTHMLENV